MKKFVFSFCLMMVLLLVISILSGYARSSVRSVNTPSPTPASDNLGTKKWEFKTGDSIDSSPAIGSDGTIYVGSHDHKLYAINPDGTEKWEFETGDSIYSSPAIGSDGTIYVGSSNYKLYAIYGSVSLANTSWPMFLHDLRHTGSK